MRIQVYLTAAVMNLKRLAAVIAPPATKAAIQRSIAALLSLLRHLPSRRPFAGPHILRKTHLGAPELTEPISVRLAA